MRVYLNATRYSPRLVLDIRLCYPRKTLEGKTGATASWRRTSEFIYLFYYILFRYLLNASNGHRARSKLHFKFKS